MLINIILISKCQISIVNWNKNNFVKISNNIKIESTHVGR